MNGTTDGDGDGDEHHVGDRSLRALSVSVVALLVVVMALFLHALVVARPIDGVLLVVVGDAAAEVGQRTPLRVLGLHRERPVALRAQVDGVALDEHGFGVVVARPVAARITGAAVTADGDTRDIDLLLTPTKTTAAATTTTTPWTSTLAVPAAGAAVYPEQGLVAGRGRSRVVLVGDTAEHRIAIVDVEPLLDARLPDGRLLAVDRLPLQATIDGGALAGGDVVVDVVAREPIVGTIDVWVGGRLLVLEPIDLAAGQTRWQRRLELPAEALVVVNIALSPLPSAARRQVLARVGGWHDDELLAVEPRAAGHLEDATVRRALGSRFVVDGARPAVLSPTFAEQERAWQQQATSDAMAARRRFRQAGVVVLGVLVVLAALARVRVLQAVAAVVIVAVVGGGLDAVLGLNLAG